MDPKKYHMIERALRWLLIMLLVEFILGVLLTTVMNYEPNKHSVLQTTVLVIHILIGIALLVGSIAHVFTSRSSKLLGMNPVKGVIFIMAAFIAGGISADSGNSWAVLVMALCFGAAITNYGLSYIKLKTVSIKK